MVSPAPGNKSGGSRTKLGSAPASREVSETGEADGANLAETPERGKALLCSGETPWRPDRRSITTDPASELVQAHIQLNACER